MPGPSQMHATAHTEPRQAPVVDVLGNRDERQRAARPSTSRRRRPAATACDRTPRGIWNRSAGQCQPGAPWPDALVIEETGRVIVGRRAHRQPEQDGERRPHDRTVVTDRRQRDLDRVVLQRRRRARRQRDGEVTPIAHGARAHIRTARVSATAAGQRFLRQTSIRKRAHFTSAIASRPCLSTMIQDFFSQRAPFRIGRSARRRRSRRSRSARA